MKKTRTENLSGGVNGFIDSCIPQSGFFHNQDLISGIIVFLLIFSLFPYTAFGEMQEISDQELAEVTGMGAVDFSIIGNTARIYFDTHIETYTEIDSLKMGYYGKDDLTTRKFLPEYDPRVIDQNNGTFKIEGGDGVARSYFVSDGNKLAYVDDDNFALDGLQGMGQNRNNMDWDINWENVRLGTSPQDPLVIDGIVVQFKFDDNGKVTEFLMGSNSVEGNVSGDFIRTTGLINPRLAYGARDSSSNLVEELNNSPVPISLQRDSMLWLVDDYRFQYDDPTDSVSPNPGDPTNNNIHSSFFLRLGLDPESPNFGVAVIAGYNEIIASSYKPSGAMIKDSLMSMYNSGFNTQ